MASNFITFLSEGGQEVMRIGATGINVSPGVSVDSAAAAVIAALEHHIQNLVLSETEALLVRARTAEEQLANSTAQVSCRQKI